MRFGGAEGSERGHSGKERGCGKARMGGWREMKSARGPDVAGTAHGSVTQLMRCGIRVLGLWCAPDVTLGCHGPGVRLGRGLYV